ncbi:hypothetical protein SAMN05421766_11022 [Zobellia uliginosa]|uniref:DUF1735 domain-containing protein n=1 Tax=Zobellia uliginosa TaxID=143224 RepID=A0ABY1L588_9FLAO|nr:DUF6452 family protein [Zobellia uliginosa]SIT10036.1 hypothetical protein SAMN05421766_11022 [Zobellia uliginosa]
MNRFKILFIILLGILSFSACEKDDICTDYDTPQVVIRFYDVLNPTEFKDVQNLIVWGVLPSGGKDTIANVALDSIVLPLRVDANSTSFALSRQLSIDDINVDTLTFNYDVTELYKSRACGYIANFENLTVTVEQDDSVWIQTIDVDNALIENTASAHVKIFH